VIGLLAASVRDLRVDLARARTQAPDLQGLAWLPRIAGVALLLIAVTCLLGGYHAAFIPLNAWAVQWPDTLWATLTSLGDEHLTLALLLPFARRNPRLIWALFWAAIIGLVYTQSIKHGLGTARPPAVLPADAFNLIGPGFHKRAFPSGHTQFAFTVACVLMVYVSDKRLRWLLLAIASLVGFSRVALGVHWPVDVLAGAFGGALAAWIGWRLATRFEWGMTLPGHVAIVAFMASFCVPVVTGREDLHFPHLAPLAMLIVVVCLGKLIHDYMLPGPNR
jgi:membrane-associated phospholipid phosphatase